MSKLPGIGSILAAAILLAGCGGGGGDSPTVQLPPPNPPPSNWTAGVFEPAANFDALCANPRSGMDPDTGLPFPDTQGTVTDENNWLRSWSNELYLWYDEIVDRDPANFTTPNYFDLLRTDETTASGQPKDRFHFSMSTEEWQQLSQSGASAGYGADWVLLQAAPPRKIIVAQVESGTSADDAGLLRGAEIIEIDGVDVINSDDAASLATLNAGLAPSAVGEMHDFTVLDPGSASPRTVTLTSAIITSDPVPTTDWLDTPTGRVGYLLFNSHVGTAEQALIDSVTSLQSAGIDDLVLDLRYNGGGFLFIASQLAYMIAGQTATAGRTFEETRFNDKHPTTNPITGELLDPIPFIDQSIGFSAQSGEALPTLSLERIYVLTGADTCSASESIVNALRGIDIDVFLIGNTTCGKPYGFFPADNCGTTYFSIQFQGVNDAGFGDYADGFSPGNTLGPASTRVPGCSVADDFDHPLGDPAEGRLAAALQFRDFGTCPAASAITPDISLKTTTAEPPAPTLVRAPWRSMRWLGGP